MKDATVTAMSHMAIGSGTTNPAAGDTALETELEELLQVPLYLVL